jgi:alpha-tubulin suppressor-like RCC1 family protein
VTILRRRLLHTSLIAVMAGCGDGTGPDSGPSVAGIVVNTQGPFPPAVLAGETLQLQASVQDSAGNVLPNRPVTWSSADPGLAQVSGTGLVTGVVPGIVTILAAAGGREGTIDLAVLERAASFLLAPSRLGIVPGGQSDVLTGFRDASDNPLDPFGRTVTWTSSDLAVASVTYAGDTPGVPRAVVHAVAPGSATITATGPDAAGSIPVDVSLVTFESIAPGVRTTCGVTTTGDAYCWGSNIYNLLANPVVSGSATPLRIEGSGSLAAISPGGGGTCGLGTDGAVSCWGDNSFGQLGNGTADFGPFSTPTPVAGGLQFSAVSSGEVFVCGLTVAAKAYCWGYGGEGQLGTGTTNNSSVPVPVAGDLSLTSISTTRGSTSALNHRHTCGVATDGEAYCWGSNLNGELGDNSATPRSAPVLVAGNLTFSSISAGFFHTCGIAGTQAYCWGDNSYRQLGFSSAGQFTPVLVPGGLPFSSVSAGFTHTCGLSPAGLAYCWGLNDVGQLGDGSDTASVGPVPVAGGLTFTSVSAGNRYSCGLTVQQLAYCWGGGDLEEPGTGVRGSTVPVRVIGQP